MQTTGRNEGTDTRGNAHQNAGAGAAAMDDARAEVERLERAFWRSLVERDAAAARALLAPDR